MDVRDVRYSNASMIISFLFFREMSLRENEGEEARRDERAFKLGEKKKEKNVCGWTNECGFIGPQDCGGQSDLKFAQTQKPTTDNTDRRGAGTR